MYLVRFYDGTSASASRWATEGAAVRAAKRIAKRESRLVKVWWCNDAGTPKVVVFSTAEG